MQKNNVLLYLDLLEKYKTLTDEQFGQFIRSLLLYAKGEPVNIFDPLVQLAFDNYKVTEDENKTKWEAKIKQCHEAARLGGIANAKRTLSEREAKQADTVTVTVPVTDNVNVTEKIKSKRAFTKPSIDECVAYALEKKLPFTGEEFFWHYEAIGWLKGKAGLPVLNWKATMHTWKKQAYKQKDTMTIEQKMKIAERW